MSMYNKFSESKLQTLQTKTNPEAAHMNILALFGVKSKIKIKVQLLVLDLSIAAAKNYEGKKKLIWTYWTSLLIWPNVCWVS